jgi:hypothetical protein
VLAGRHCQHGFHLVKRRGRSVCARKKPHCHKGYKLARKHHRYRCVRKKRPSATPKIAPNPGNGIDLLAWAKHYALTDAANYRPPPGDSLVRLPRVEGCGYVSPARARCTIYTDEWATSTGSPQPGCTVIFDPCYTNPPPRLEWLVYRDWVFAIPYAGGVAEETTWDAGRYQYARDSVYGIVCSDLHRRGTASCQPGLYP